MRDNTGGILYVGKAIDLFKRVSSYFVNRSQHTAKTSILVASIRHIDYIPADSEREALIIEQQLINKLQPPFNVMWRDDKSYPFLKITWGEDFPRMFMTRRKVKDSARYFGPYPNVRAMKNLLRYFWKNHIFPLRPCHFEFSEANPLPLEKAKQCLYYHTKECPAPCVGRISKPDYRRIAEEAILFFRGKTETLSEQWNVEMKEAAARRDYERAAQLRDNLGALTHMEERVTVRKIEASEVASRTDKSRAISELQQALDLRHPPMRIECFDISHIQGVETVASMVVFEKALPKKSDYRKFKIRSVEGIDDFASMGEVVARRYRRVFKEGEPVPDLILIDGGKGQLSAAQKALKDVTSEHNKASKKRIALIPMAALAKQEEELFLPEKSESVRLSKDSPALLLVMAVRDEAHRFAITFHRERRGKRALS